MTAKGNFRNGVIVFCIFTFFTVLCFIVNPDWMYLYFIDSKRPGLLSYVLFGLYPLFFIAGVTISKKLGRKGVYTVIISASALLLVIFVLTIDRAFFGGTYEEFVGSGVVGKFPDIISFFKSDIGKLALLGGAIFIATSLFLVSKDKKLKDFLLQNLGRK